MRNAATLGGNTLSDTGEMAFFDSGDTPETAAAAARLAVAAGARMIVGPLFGAQVAAVSQAVGSNVAVLTLSNDVNVAGGGVFVLGVTPEQSARAVLTFAARRGLNTVGVVAPTGAFGARSAEAALLVGKATGQTMLPPIVGTDPAIVLAKLANANGGGLPKAVYLPVQVRNWKRWHLRCGAKPKCWGQHNGLLATPVICQHSVMPGTRPRTRLRLNRLPSLIKRRTGQAPASSRGSPLMALKQRAFWDGYRNRPPAA
ncbi:MAG: hypothetical protein E8G75_11180 [Sulfitobacter sp. SK025]|nr:MAG: hypothetical protein E8G75_11180 [Sulfitobacter sp. SK025]